MGTESLLTADVPLLDGVVPVGLMTIGAVVGAGAVLKDWLGVDTTVDGAETCEVGTVLTSAEVVAGTEDGSTCVELAVTGCTDGMGSVEVEGDAAEGSVGKPHLPPATLSVRP